MSVALTVIVPLYNGATTIERALDSVLSQSDRSIEIVVVDDCSTDGGPDLVNRLYVATGNGTVRLVQMERNGGPAAARNRGMAEASGEWLALLDADDVWLPARLDHAQQYFEGDDVIADEIVGFDMGANCFTGPFLRIGEAGYLGLEEVACKTREGRDFDNGFLKPFFRRAFIERHRIAYDHRLRQGEDWLFYLECVAVGAKIHLIDFPGYGYSTWVGAVSGIRSATSHTRPGAEALADALEELINRRADVLSSDDSKLLAEIAARIRYDAGAWTFDHAVLHRDVVGAIAALFRSRSAREAAMSKLGHRFIRHFKT